MKINITSNLLTKLNVLSSEYSIEVGGYLTGEIRDGEIYLQDIIIPNQLISGVSVNIRPQDQVDLLRRYGDKCKKIIGKWHSHHNMGAFWSSIDANDIREIMEYKDLYVFMVSSLGNHLIKVCIKKPFKYEINDVKLFPKTVDLDIMRQQVDKLISQNTNSPIRNFKEDNSEILSRKSSFGVGIEETESDDAYEDEDDYENDNEEEEDD